MHSFIRIVIDMVSLHSNRNPNKVESCGGFNKNVSHEPIGIGTIRSFGLVGVGVT